MTVAIGELQGNGLSALCHVRRDAEGATYIEHVTPALPVGDYRLSVNGLTVNARYAKGCWQQLDD
jgi:hypothetical protein